MIPGYGRRLQFMQLSGALHSAINALAKIVNVRGSPTEKTERSTDRGR